VPALAQIQQAWVAHYNNGITNGTNQAVKIALDSAGNIYVTGFSQNANSQLGYVTIKYAPNGNQLWATRYDSNSYPAATPVAIVLDGSNEVIVTGSALTIKYDPDGKQLWTASYAGSALGCDGAGDGYVTGFGTNFNTVKLTSTGSNLWLTTYKDVGPTVGQAIAIDTNGNAFVVGSDTFGYYGDGEVNYPEVELMVIKYTSNGSRAWLSTYQDTTPVAAQVNGAALDNSNNLIFGANFYGVQPYLTLKYNGSGTLLWAGSPPRVSRSSMSQSMQLDQQGNVLFTGQIPYALVAAGYNYYFGTFKFNPSGNILWTNQFPQPAFGSSVPSAITVDSANNSYVTGYSPGTNSLNDIVTIKYGPNGNQVWLQRYNGPGNGNAAGNAIAIDNNGNVYVAGYDTTTAGGTEMVLIKYSPLVLQKQPNGTVLLQAQGYAGESFDIQASEDLFHWLDLGSVTADTNGLMQFDDTNAANYPARFYYTNPQ
jgi:outer membrane protein assembly factor BamB